MPELRVAVAGLNSTMAVTHRYGGRLRADREAQASWFAERLRPFEESGWLRVGVVRHDPLPGASGADDPATLRDAATLDALLGNRLNLLLHGPGPGGSSAELLGDRLPVLPAAGRAEIVHLTAAGLRRYAARSPRPGEPVEAPLERTWRAAAHTFAPAPPAAPPQPPAIGPGSDPHTLLLQRLADVCAARDPDARIRRVDTTPPQLLVTNHNDGLTLSRRLGARVGAVTPEALEEFLQHDPTDADELVYQGPPPAEAVRRPPPAARPAAQLHRVPGPARPARTTSPGRATAAHRPPLPPGHVRAAAIPGKSDGHEPRNATAWSTKYFACSTPIKDGSCCCSATSATARRSHCARSPAVSPPNCPTLIPVFVMN